MIEIKDLYKKFGRVEVLKSLNLTIDNNGIFAILGPNGSGKTTLIKSILGISKPNKGDILINKKNIKKKWEYRNDISYLAQIADFPNNLTVNELISFIKSVRHNAIDENHLVDIFKLAPFLDKKISNLSGGTRQKVNIILTFMFDSQILFLDEPTTGLDPLSLIQLKKLIMQEREKKKIIIISSHIMSFVEEVSDEIVFLLEGKIYFKGSISTLKKETKEPNFEYAIASLLNR